MLFAIKLAYIRPPEEIQAHLEAHKIWLAHHIQAGTILCAGPLAQGKGGFVLAHGQDLAEIQRMIAEDPFDAQKLVTFDIQCCEPVIRAADFPAHWAGEARPLPRAS